MSIAVAISSVLLIILYYWVFGVGLWLPWFLSVTCLAVASYMFGDTFRGSVDMASASMKYLYNKASKFGTTSFDPNNLTPEEKRLKLDRFKGTYVGGLYNEGNTCFINSVVQALASCRPISEFCLEARSDDNFSFQFYKLLGQLNQIRPGHHSYSTTSLMSRIGGTRRWSRYDQEDAQEFFQQILMVLEKDHKEKHPPGEEQGTNATVPGPPKRITPFDSYSATRVGCLNCGDMEGVRVGVLSSLDLSLDAQHTSYNLIDLIRSYCEMETIPDVECYRCTLLDYRKKLEARAEAPGLLQEALKRRIAELDAVVAAKIIDDKRYQELKYKGQKILGVKTKQTLFAPPLADVIMVHINRSVFDMNSGYSRKNYSPVDFPALLDMSEFTTDPDNPKNAELATDMHPVNDDDLKYQLKAAVMHYGSANFGHYVCFRKFNGVWWRTNDDSVELTTEAQVLESKGIFMLFYERERESDRQLQAQAEAQSKVEDQDAEAISVEEPRVAATYEVDGDNEANEPSKEKNVLDRGPFGTKETSNL